MRVHSNWNICICTLKLFCIRHILQCIYSSMAYSLLPPFSLSHILSLFSLDQPMPIGWEKKIADKKNSDINGLNLYWVPPSIVHSTPNSECNNDVRRKCLLRGKLTGKLGLGFLPLSWFYLSWIHIQWYMAEEKMVIFSRQSVNHISTVSTHKISQFFPDSIHDCSRFVECSK